MSSDYSFHENEGYLWSNKFQQNRVEEFSESIQ
jgi:hypothetical protein